MKPTVRYAPCPYCGITTWSVYGPDGSHWLCASSQSVAITYAAERAAGIEQPGTGDQVQRSEGASK